MLYLSYSLDGFVKQFPLNESVLHIGRDPENHIVLADDFISRKHLNIMVRSDSLLVEDVGSENGFRYMENTTKIARINVGDSFSVGKIQFTLLSGNDSDFIKSEDISTIDTESETLPVTVTSAFYSQKTKSMSAIFLEIEKELMSAAVKYQNFSAFVTSLGKTLSYIPNLGTLLLIGVSKSIRILFSVNDDGNGLAEIQRTLEKDPRFFSKSTPRSNRFQVFPLKLEKEHSFLVYFPQKKGGKINPKLENFIHSLSDKISTLYQIFSEGQQKKKELVSNKKIVEIVTNSAQMKALIEQAKKIAASDIFLLIHGESGTGKELFAQLIHQYSKRRNSPFVALNCAAIPENLLESELYGYEKGAFTGAFKQKTGKLELASGGTLVLDEIGDMPLSIQVKLLRAIQEGRFYRLGGSVPIDVNLRIISMTHQNLTQMIEEKRFREDLYYRLVHRSLNIPPLRSRTEDIPALVNYFTGRFCRESRKNISGFSIKTMDALLRFHWKGNVRQLENEVISILNLCDDGDIVNYHLLSDHIKSAYESLCPSNETASINTNSQSEQREKKSKKKLGPLELLEVMEQFAWNKTRAAEHLGMTYHGLHKKLKRLDIKKPGLS